MKTFLTRSPFLFALATTSIAMLCLIWPLWIPGSSQATQAILGRIAICIFAIDLLTHLGWWRETGFVRPKSWRILLPYLPLLLIVIALKITDIASFGIRVTDVSLILLGLFVYVAGGFMEEAVFRGLVLRTLLPKGLVRAALLSSLIFALCHLLNLTLGANLYDTLLQVAVAFLMGLAFTAPLAVTRNIWPLVFIHALYNFVGYLAVGGFLNTAATSQSPTLAEAIFQILFPLPLAIYSFWLLLRTERRIFQKSTVVEARAAVGQAEG